MERLNKINELLKVLKNTNDAFNKRFGDIKVANKETLIEAGSITLKASFQMENSDIKNIRQKVLEVFAAIQYSNIPKEAFNKYSEMELDYLIKYFNLMIEECNKR